MLTIWGRKTSSNVQALMWCVGELGLAYERHDVGHNKYGGNDTGAFLQMNPNGRSNENVEAESPFHVQACRVTAVSAAAKAQARNAPNNTLNESASTSDPGTRTTPSHRH
jgi:hypothetical protein